MDLQMKGLVNNGLEKIKKIQVEERNGKGKSAKEENMRKEDLISLFREDLTMFPSIFNAH